MNDRIKYVIIPPDGVGSKGDEAMISGLLNILKGEPTLFLTQNHKQWCDVLLGRPHLFDEKTVPLEEMHENVTEAEWLIVIGADTLDGSCGYEAAYWRLCAVESAVAAGGNVVVFCSIRSDMDDRIIQKWKSLPAGVHIFLRDCISEKNFSAQVGYPTKHFSDLAFFAKPIYTKRASSILQSIQNIKATKKVIGLQISETMFRSFNTEISDENREAFAMQIAALAVSGMSDVEVVLLTHDTREWDAHWSDYHYACVAQKKLNQIEGVSCTLQPPELTQAELLTIIPELDLVICGRMHMSITAFCSDVIPLLVAGEGKDYVMIDKVRGMCREWLGMEKNLLQDIQQIPQHRDWIMQNSEMHDLLKKKKNELKITLPQEERFMESLLGVESQVADTEHQEDTMLRMMQRSAQLSHSLHEEEMLRKNKEAHIELLLQSERDLLAEKAKQAEQIEKLQFELGYQAGMTEQLRQTEAELCKELEEAYRQINRLQYELGSKDWVLKKYE